MAQKSPPAHRTSVHLITLVGTVKAVVELPGSERGDQLIVLDDATRIIAAASVLGKHRAATTGERISEDDTVRVLAQLAGPNTYLATEMWWENTDRMHEIPGEPFPSVGIPSDAQTASPALTCRTLDAVFTKPGSADLRGSFTGQKTTEWFDFGPHDPTFSVASLNGFGVVCGLEPNTTYYYRYETRKEWGTEDGKPISCAGDIKSFTTRPR